MTDPAPIPPFKRPPAITVICAFWIGMAPIQLSVLASWPNTLPGLKAALIVIAVLKLVGLIGYWKMQKWSVALYAVCSVAHLGCDVLAGMPVRAMMPHILYAINVFIGLFYLPAMTNRKRDA